MKQQFYESNLRVVTQRWPDLALRLQAVKPIPVAGIQSRDGHWIFQSASGQAVHSTYAPLRESERFMQSCQADTVLFLGLGCGYQVLPFLKESRFVRFLILDSSLSLVKGLLQNLDYQEIFKDPRVQLIIPETIEDWSAGLANLYHPLWHGQLINYPLRAIVDQDKDFYHAVIKELAQYYDRMSGDLSSQAFFAKNWFRNILLNLYYYQPQQCQVVEKKSKMAYLAGAGPSLEDGLDDLRSAQKQGHIILSCDAALRPLVLQGIIPDYVLSLDAQQAVCRHFVGMSQHGWTLVCDLCSPPSLTRSYESQFFSGGHPLGQMSAFPALDTRGGNVGYAVLSFAQSQGWQIKGSYGFDFCFPQAKPYARGVYVYPEYEKIALRTASYEQAILDLVFRYKTLNKTQASGMTIYQPQVFQMYQDYFQQLYHHPRESAHAYQQGMPQNSAGRDFVRHYKQKLQSSHLAQSDLIPSQGDPLSLTLAPLVASFLQKDRSISVAWNEAVSWSLSFLEQLD